MRNYEPCSQQFLRHTCNYSSFLFDGSDSGEVPAQCPGTLPHQLSAEVTLPTSGPTASQEVQGNMLVPHISPPSETTNISPPSAPTHNTYGKFQKMEALKTPSKGSPFISIPVFSVLQIKNCPLFSTIFYINGFPIFIT